MQRNALLAFAIIASLAAGAALPGLFGRLTAPSGEKTTTSATTSRSVVDTLIRLTPEQIVAAKIETARVGPGALGRRLIVPATIKPDPDQLARVAAKVSGVVAQMRKRLNAEVAQHETIAVIDSREVADAKSEYLAATVNYDLQAQLFQREKRLFERGITAEVLFLKAKATYTEAKLRNELARQKLAALDLSEAEIASLSGQSIERLREKEIRAPISGRVIERLVNIGQPVTAETQIYVLADLSVVEADLAVPLASLASIRKGQPVTLTTPDGHRLEGQVSIISAIVTPETRTGHVVASFKNRDFALNPGILVNAEIALAQAPVDVMIPRIAIQTIHNEPTVFVKVAGGFEKRSVETGDGDEASVEIVKGLKAGEAIAVVNSFLLKAEAGKNEIPEE
jgi:cobalt-zinc-cadmium efflux system membrane fusion protein